MDSLRQAYEMVGAERQILFWIIPALLAVIALYLLVPTLRAWALRRRLEKIIARLGPEALSNVVLEDGMDGLVHIQRIVAGPRGLTVLTLVPLDGIIFGGEGIDQWTQVLGRRTYKFSNPLDENREGIIGIHYHLPEAPVKGVVLFTGNCSFPKGRPEGVIVPDDLARPGAQLTIPADVRPVWDQLKALAADTAQRHRDELRILREPPALGRPLLGFTLLIVAGALAGWAGLQLV